MEGRDLRPALYNPVFDIQMKSKLQNLLKNINTKDAAVLFAAALIVRAGALFFYGINNIIGADSGEYDTYALNLLKDHYYHFGAVRSFRAPLYPFFLSAVYFIFGHYYSIVKLIQIVIGSLNCVLTYVIALDITERKQALIAGWISCFYFALIDNSAFISTETLFIFLIIVSTLLILRVRESGLTPFFAGIFIALSALIRPTTLILPFFTILWFFFKFNLRKAIIFSALLSTGFIMMLVPWAIRNYRIHHAFAPVNLQSGLVFWASNNQFCRGRECQVLIDYAKYSKLTEFERDKAYAREGITWLKSLSAPQLVKHYSLKLISFFYPFLPEYPIKDSYILNSVKNACHISLDFVNPYDPTFGFVIPFWLLGAYFALRSKNTQLLYLIGVIISFLVSALIYYGGETRFRAAYSPYVLIFSAIGIAETTKWRYGSVAITAWGILNAVCFYFYAYVYGLMQFILTKIRAL
jgi:4-amino-4-deoxy-L-arabinose transferase-like glycosyltransferase